MFSNKQKGEGCKRVGKQRGKGQEASRQQVDRGTVRMMHMHFGHRESRKVDTSEEFRKYSAEQPAFPSRFCNDLAKSG